MGFIDSTKRAASWIAKAVIDSVFDIIVDGGFNSELLINGPPKQVTRIGSGSNLSRSIDRLPNRDADRAADRNAAKVDAVRKVFKYESLVFHMWRSLWCTYVTIVAFFNVLRIGKVLENDQMDNVFSRGQNALSDLTGIVREAKPLEYHTYYDRKTASDLKLMMGFLLIDVLVYLIRRKFMTKSTLIHHALCIVLCIIALYSPYPHHYHANVFLCAELVSCMTILAHFAKKCHSRLLHKLYLTQYLLLTVFGRGTIWYMIFTDLITIGASPLCYIGFAPLVLMDITWARQCMEGLQK